MKWVRRALKKSLQALPFKWRQELIRKFAKVPLTLPKNFELKVVDSMAELEATFRLVYTSYVKIGYCEPNPHQMRATRYHALPSTSTLIAKDAGSVVATLTLVRDNRLGLPLESVFNVRGLRQKGRRVAEVTSLVIDRQYRRRAGGALLFPMMKLMYEYSTSYFGVSYLVIAVHPRDIDFYKALLLFDVVPGCEQEDYYGAPASVLCLDLEKARVRYREVFGKKSAVYNYAEFFMDRKYPQIKLPDRRFNQINDPIVTLEDYQEVFVKKLGIEVPDNVVHLQHESASMRAHLRFESHNELHSADELTSTAFKGIVKDVSRCGIRVHFDEDPQLPVEFTIKIMVADNRPCLLKVRPIWKNSQNGVGLEIVQNNQIWNEYINYLEGLYSQKPA